MPHLEETVRRVEKWLKGEKQEPTKVDIFFTERCNLKCRFCNYPKISSEVVEKEISDKRILGLIDEICEMDVKVFGVLGGEPFLRKEVLLESMKKIKANEISGSVVTNGTLLEEKDLEKLVKIEWDLIRFSIDGLQETHDYLRGVKGAFDKVFKSVRILHKLKKIYKSNFPTVEINFVLTNKNYSELGKLVKSLSPYGINFIYVLPMIELTEESKYLKINNVREVKRFLEEAKDISEEYNIRSNIEEIVEKNLFLYSNKMKNIILENNKKLPACFLPWYTMNINSDGSATPCAQWPKSEGIRIEKSLRSVWFDDFEKMREKISSGLPEWCSRCCVPLVDENKEIRKKLA
jgi:MoaA/NifB/PqqE/SkfB family radical SAM enzyme